MVVSFGHVYSVLVNGNAGRERQLSTSSSLAPKLPQVLALWSEDLDTMVTAISNVHVPVAVECNIPGVLELSVPVSLCAECFGEDKVSAKDLNPVVVLVTYVEFPVCGTEDNTNWVPELQLIDSA